MLEDGFSFPDKTSRVVAAAVLLSIAVIGAIVFLIPWKKRTKSNEEDIF